MKSKILKISGIAAAIAFGLGVSSIGQAAVIIVRHAPPPTVVVVHPQVRCYAYPSYVICYPGGHPQKYYQYSFTRSCDSHGICTQKKCYSTPYGRQCYSNTPNRVY